MEHALRFHIRKNFDEDPARYTKLSERLDDILKNLTGSGISCRLRWSCSVRRGDR